MLIKTKKPKPRRVLMYGTKGIGKSTWANSWWDAYFVNIEDGVNDIECASSAWLRTYDAVVQEVSDLIAGTSPGSPAKTIVIDSADWLESLIFQTVAKAEGKASVDLIGYNKGYVAAADMLSYMLGGLNHLRDQGKHIVFLAHEAIIKHSPPGGDAYDRYSPALHKETSAVLTEWVDEVLFASYKTFTKSTDTGFGQTRTVALNGAPQRLIRTRETAAIVAKNRLAGIPDEISMDFAEFAKYLPTLASPQQPAAPEGNIAGHINNGSSKPLVTA